VNFITGRRGVLRALASTAATSGLGLHRRGLNPRKSPPNPWSPVPPALTH
jgi:hypothetical protein